MDAVKQIEQLIEAGWHVLNSDFEENSFHQWREQAYKYIVATLGADHPYAVYFRRYVKHSKREDLLAGGGILSATKEDVVAKRSKEDRIASEEKLYH